jgi:hypothetical protein
MFDSHFRSGFTLSPIVVLTLIVGAIVAFVVVSNRQVPEGPVPVVWDKTACAHCVMHLGDPRFAAQLTTTSGDTFFYDDPGCLFLHRRTLLETSTKIHAMWFCDMNGNGWLSQQDVAFLATEGSPMDFGFGAIQRGFPTEVLLENVDRTFLKR